MAAAAPAGWLGGTGVELPTDASGAPPAAGAPPTPAPGDINGNLGAFSALLGNQTSGAIGDYFSEAARLRGVGTGASDPAFAAYQTSQNAQLNANQNAETQQQAEFFNRRGMSDSSAALNQQNKTAASYDLQRSSLASSLGLADLSRKDDAMASAMNVEGAGVSLAAKPAELSIAELAAQNAGKMPDQPNNGANSGINSWGPALQSALNSSGAQDIFAGVATGSPVGAAAQATGGGTVLCTLIYSRGDLPKHIYEADCAYGRKYPSITTFRGYYLWGKPLADLARRKPWVYACVRPFASAWAHRMAHKMGVEAAPHWGGAVFQTVVQPICFFLGCGLVSKKKLTHRLVRLLSVA